MARLSLGKTDHSLAAAQDFSGATGTLTWDWRPSAKLAFSTQFNRSTGNESSFTRIGGPASALGAQADNSRLTTTWSVNLGYDLSAKVRLDASFSHGTRTLTNAISINAAQPSSATDGDRLQRLRPALRYVPTRSVELSCSLGREARKRGQRDADLRLPCQHRWLQRAIGAAALKPRGSECGFGAAVSLRGCGPADLAARSRSDRH